MQILKDSDSNNNEKDKKYYNNFLYSYKTEVTRKNSLSILKYYMKLLGVKTLRALVDKSQQIIESDIKAYLVYLRTKRKIYTLGPRIYPKDQPIPYDSDSWLQFYNCGQITPKVHAKQQNEIAPIVDPPETIHDSKKVVVLTTKEVFS
jgi:hypothetical protein